MVFVTKPQRFAKRQSSMSSSNISNMFAGLFRNLRRLEEYPAARFNLFRFCSPTEDEKVPWIIKTSVDRQKMDSLFIKMHETQVFKQAATSPEPAKKKPRKAQQINGSATWIEDRLLSSLVSQFLQLGQVLPSSCRHT